jgi:hypothetical protein
VRTETKQITGHDRDGPLGATKTALTSAKEAGAGIWASGCSL